MGGYGNLNALDLLTAMSFALTIHNTELAEQHGREFRELNAKLDRIIEMLNKEESS